MAHFSIWQRLNVSNLRLLINGVLLVIIVQWNLGNLLTNVSCEIFWNYSQVPLRLSNQWTFCDTLTTFVAGINSVKSLTKHSQLNRTRNAENENMKIPYTVRWSIGSTYYFLSEEQPGLGGNKNSNSDFFRRNKINFANVVTILADNILWGGA